MSTQGDDFLNEMATISAARVRRSRKDVSLAELRERVRRAEPPRPLRLSPSGFDVIAEVKFQSPAEGALRPPSAREAADRARLYGASGAACVSVLTEESRFGGSLEHLRAAAQATRVPVLRKDFVVDAYQVFEARAFGASGVLLILRILDDVQLSRCLAACRETRLFPLLEAFDARDLVRAAHLFERAELGLGRALLGVNARDLETLAVEPDRHVRLAPLLPAGITAVAESGLFEAEDARRARTAGYRMALVGTALMRSRQPLGTLRMLLAGGRTNGEAACPST